MKSWASAVCQLSVMKPAVVLVRMFEVEDST